MVVKSRIKDIRNQKGISQEKLAQKCEISARTIQNLEKEINESIIILIKIKNALGCNFEDLFEIIEK